MAEDLMDFLVDEKILDKKEICITKNYKLIGNEEKHKDLEKLISFYPITKNTKESLITLYGTNATKVLTLANKLDNFQLINENLPYLKVEIIYCIENEFVKKPVDFLSRRIGLCFIDKKASLSCVDVVCDEMGKLYNWNKDELELQKKESKEYIENYF